MATKVKADHVFVVDTMYPTEAIDRLKRGDTVPAEDCGWVLAPAGTVCREADFDPFVWKSLKRMGKVKPLLAEAPLPIDPEQLVALGQGEG